MTSTACILEHREPIDVTDMGLGLGIGFGLIWVDLSWSGLIWPDLSSSELICIDMSWSGQISADLSWSELIWADRGWSGLIWADLSTEPIDVTENSHIKCRIMTSTACILEHRAHRRQAFFSSFWALRSESRVFYDIKNPPTQMNHDPVIAQRAPGQREPWAETLTGKNKPEQPKQPNQTRQTWQPKKNKRAKTNKTNNTKKTRKIKNITKTQKTKKNK